MVTRGSTRRWGVDLRQRIAHGVFAESGHVVVAQVEGGDAGASDEESAHVATARIVHVRVGGRESSEMGQGSGDSGQQPRSRPFDVTVGDVEPGQRGEARHHAVHASDEIR
jgi:hypothetical protein